MAYKYNPLSDNLDWYNDSTGLTFKAGVVNESALPSEDNSINDARIANDTQNLYVWDGSEWQNQGDIFDVSVNWGDIEGTLSDQSDLQSGLNNKVSSLDALVDNTVLLLNFDDSIVTDDTGRHTGYVSYYPSMIHDTVTKKYGAGSIEVSNLLHQHMQISKDSPNIRDFDFLSHIDNIYIVEMYINSSDGSNQRFNLFSYGNDQDGRIYSSYDQGNFLFNYRKNNSTQFSFTASYPSSSLFDGAWHHVLWIKNGNKYGIYLDGVQVLYATSDVVVSIWDIEDTTLYYFVGHNFFTNMEGNIDAYRVIKENIYDLNPVVELTDSFIIPTEAPIYSAPSDKVAQVEIAGSFSRSELKVSDVSDSISKKHVQNTDTILDEGGTNEVSAESLKSDNLYFIINDNGAMGTGIKGSIMVPYDCEILSVTLLADQSGSIVVDIWKDSYNNYPPTDEDSITASATPTISSDVSSQDNTLTGWTVALSSGDVLSFNVDSVDSITTCSVILNIKRT